MKARRERDLVFLVIQNFVWVQIESQEVLWGRFMWKSERLGPRTTSIFLRKSDRNLGERGIFDEKREKR